MGNRALQLLLVMGSLDRSVVTKRRQTTVSSAIGVHRQDHPLGSMQAHGFANLLDYELSIPLHLRRRQTSRSPRKLDGIGLPDTDALQELTNDQVEALIEAP